MFDLKSKFGKQYRVTSEDFNPRNQDPWLWRVECRQGHIYLHAPDRLAVATDSSHAALIRRLLDVRSARLEQLGEDGANVSFAPADFRAVAAIVKPRRRRQLTEQQKAATSDRLIKSRFPARQSAKTSAKRVDAPWVTKSTTPANNAKQERFAHTRPTALPAIVAVVRAKVAQSQGGRP